MSFVNVNIHCYSMTLSVVNDAVVAVLIKPSVFNFPSMIFHLIAEICKINF